MAAVSCKELHDLHVMTCSFTSLIFVLFIPFSICFLARSANDLGKGCLPFHLLASFFSCLVALAVEIWLFAEWQVPLARQGPTMDQWLHNMPRNFHSKQYSWQHGNTKSLEESSLVFFSPPFQGNSQDLAGKGGEIPQPQSLVGSWRFGFVPSQYLSFV